MSQYSASFKQSPAETKRYVMDFTLQLAPGESVSSLAVVVQQNAGAASPALSISSVALLPALPSGQVDGAAFFVSGGATGGVYEVQFLTTTTLTQVLEDVVLFTLAEKL